MVLPLPVGPVTRTSPSRRLSIRRSQRSSSAASRSCSSDETRAAGSNTRSTAFSPKTVGRVETRSSISFSDSMRLMRPSWGRRFSAMSSPLSILRRLTTARYTMRGKVCMVRRTPSTRKRTTAWSRLGSRWMSEARCSNAWWRMLSRAATTGRVVGSRSPAASDSETNSWSAAGGLALSPWSWVSSVSAARSDVRRL